MPRTLQIKRGNTSYIGSITPAQGELVVNTDNSVLSVGDGSTSGGIKTSPLTYTQASFDAANTKFSSTGGTISGDTTFSSTANVTVNGTFFNNQSPDSFVAKTGATGTVTHDCSATTVFYHTSISANFTANFTNLYSASNYISGVTLILVQGSSAYMPTAVQLGGVAKTITWVGGSVPSGNPNKTDVVSFSFLNNSGTITVLGQLTTFG